MTESEKIDELRRLADQMYDAAAYITTDASCLKHAIEEYRQFILVKFHEEEPVSEELEEEVDEYILNNFDDAEGRVYVLQCARHFANWQKERIKKSLDLGEPPYLISIEQAYYRTIKLLED